MSMDFAARDAAAGAASLARLAGAATPAAPRVAFAGDSFYDFAVNRGGLPLLFQYTNFSVVNWLRWRFGDRMRTDPAWFVAAGGTRIDHLLGVQLPAILAAGADLVLINCGTNNVGSTTAAQMVADMKAVIAQTSARGIGVVWNSVLPQNSWSPARFQQAAEFNQQLARVAADPASRLWVADLHPPMIDFATGFATPDKLIGDGVHPSLAGTLAMESVIGALLDRILPPGGGMPTYTVSDLYDAVLNPSGNLIRGGLYTGTSGNPINGGTGAIANYWNGGFATSGGSTMTASFAKDVASGHTNLPVQAVTLGGIADGNSITMQATETANGSGALVMPAGIGAGTTLQATFRLSWSGLTNVRQAVARLSCDAGGQTYEVQDGAGGVIAGQYSLGVLPADRTGVILRPAPLMLANGFSGVRMRVQITPLTAGLPVAGTVTLQQAALRAIG